jgi:dUTP pyrophosphatase
MDNLDELDILQEKLKNLLYDSGVDFSEDSEDIKRIQEMLGMDINELANEMELTYKTKTINIEKTHPDAIIPTYAYPSDSGFDLYALESVVIKPFGREAIPTGIKVSFDEGYEIQVRPKSGLALNMGLTVLNTPGTVDQGYTGEIKVIVFNTNNNSVMIEKGMKIAQGVLCPVIQGKYVKINEVNSVGEKDRNNNGFGSTGIGL